MVIIDEKVLDTFRDGPCEWCGRSGECDPHHLYARGQGGGSRLDVVCNLIALCRECHTKVHLGIIKKPDLVYKAWEREIWKLLREVKGSQNILITA